MSIQLQIIPYGTTRLLMNQTVRYVTQLTLITSEAELQTTGLHVFLKTLEKTSFTKILHDEITCDFGACDECGSFCGKHCCSTLDKVNSTVAICV